MPVSDFITGASAAALISRFIAPPLLSRGFIEKDALWGIAILVDEGKQLTGESDAGFSGSKSLASVGSAAL